MVLKSGKSCPQDHPCPAGTSVACARWQHWVRILAHAVALTPLGLILLAWTRGSLGANPIRELTLRTGHAALLLLVLSLASTPARILTGFVTLQGLRKPLGLYAFFYAALHLLTYIGLDFGFNLAFLWPDVRQQPFIQVGFVAFLLLLALALTSTRRSIKRLGRNWRRLHRIVYLAAFLALAHFFLLVKGDWRRPLVYSIIVALLLVARLPFVRAPLTGLRRGLARLLRDGSADPGR